MANINLLPWREEYRQEKKKEFQVQLVFICLIAGLIAFLWITKVNGDIDNQNQRNRMLETEISSLEKRVQEISELKKRREELISRMKVIQDLQGTRPTIVRYFDEMVRAVPDGIFFTQLERKGDVIYLTGVTESSNRVSTFMRNLDNSDWLAEPNLKSITANPSFGEQAQEFALELQAVLPSTEEEEAK